MSDKLSYEYEARLELLRSQLRKEREGHARAVQRLDLAERLVQRFMQLNFPVIHGQATAIGMDVIEEADQVLRALRTGKDLTEDFPTPFSAAPAEPDQDKDRGDGELHQTQPTQPTLSTEEAITAFQIIGETADYDVITLRWARRLGLDDVPERKVDNLDRMKELRKMMEDLLSGDELAPYVNVEYVATSGHLARYQKQHLVYLTETEGVPEYRRRFGKEPVHKETPPGEGHAFIRPQTYPSEECWWGTRLTQALIEAGNQSQQSPFSYTVYDPCVDQLPDDLKRRYPDNKLNKEGSEPDLFVVMEPIGGTTVRVAIEFERAKYHPTQLYTKIRKNFNHYRELNGMYYIGSSLEAVKKIKHQMKTVSANATDPKKPRPPAAPGIAVVFRVSALENAWLPSPAQVDRFFQTPPDNYSNMAKPYHYYKYKG